MAVEFHHWRGNKIHESEPKRWRYTDGVEVTKDPARACGHCGLAVTAEGHDGCLGEVPGVVNACCGHGVESEAYVVLAAGERLAGADAVAWFAGESLG